MYAIVETGGKQYRVSPGETLRVEKLAGEVGSEVELPALAIFQDGGELLAGADAGKVKATIVANGRGKKIVVFKFKHKKQYKRTQGHRQDFTEVKVGEIVA
jgi:large subunit ribosomal protein L21